MIDYDGAAAWDGISSSIISDCLGRFQGMEPAIADLVGLPLIGPAFTVQVVAGENGTIHRAVAEAPAGSVLVIDAAAAAERAVWGDILAAAAQARGIRGAVIDGAVRDIAAIRRRGFPIFARGVAVAGPHKGWPGVIGEVIQCGRVVVAPADLIFADASGGVVVPRARLPETHRAALALAVAEEDWLTRIEQGESTLDILELTPTTAPPRRDA